MKRSVSATQWFALAGSILFCVAVLTARQRFPLLRIGADAEFAALLAERDTLRANDDATRDTLRTQIHSIPRWDRTRIEALRLRLGPAWDWAFHEDNPALRIATLARLDARASDWPAILTALRTLEPQPGIAVREIELVRAPAGFARVRIELAWLP